jgi:S1-C subfamily serine protease
MTAFTTRLTRSLGLLLALGLAALPPSGLSAPVGGAPDQPAAPDGAAQADAGGGQPDVIGNSVVKIFATLRYPDIAKPWAKQAPSEISGSGMVIEGKRILTNAHMVLYASEIQVQSSQSGDRVSATVVGVAPGIDLAVLKLDDESFFNTHPPLQRASKLPTTKDPVVVYGYPTGGTSLSITKGIVSRIEYTYYNFPVSGLRIQIDAAINHGNSGGPAMVGDKVIGLAFSFLGGAQNIGYIIPTEEIDLMLKGVENGGYKGKFASFDGLQTLENPALRTFLKLDPSVHGIIVARPDSDDAAYPLRRWDVITQIGDAAVDDQGMIKLGGDLRVQFSYLIPRLARNGTVPIKVERDGASVAVDLPVKTDYPTLFPGLRGAYPSYFIYGPLVFTAATAELLAHVDSTPGLERTLELRTSPLVTRRADRPAFEGEGIVCVSSPFFPSKLSTGYSDPAFRTVSAVNGIPIRNLIHLVQVLRDSREKYIVIEFADKRVEKLIFPQADMIAATEGILTENGVRSQGSEDTMAEWGKAAP